MNHTNLAEISTVIYNHIWHQIQIRKERIRQYLSTKINEEPTQKILKQSGHEYQQTYFEHLVEIEKSYDRYIDSMNHMAQIIPCEPNSGDILALYDRVISGWLMLLSINDQCRANIGALPDVSDEEFRVDRGLSKSKEIFGKQLKAYSYFTVCLCFLTITGIGSNWFRLLLVAVGSAYFIITAIWFTGETAKCVAQETEELKLWLQLKQKIVNIHHDLIGLTALIQDTLECVKTMWDEKKQLKLENM